MTRVCCEWEVSIRRACRVLLVDTSTYHYKSRRCGQADLEKRIKEIAETRMRYGYRRVHVVLQREGWMVNIKRTYRLYTGLGPVDKLFQVHPKCLNQSRIEQMETKAA